MSSCCCSLAGTATCRTCSLNPFAETPPPVRTYTVGATGPVLITGQKTNSDRIRQMTDEELAKFNVGQCCPPGVDVSEKCHDTGAVPPVCYKCWLSWLKSPVEVDDETG